MNRPVPDIAALRRRLQHWYRRHRRDLPWRRTNDPYAIWISEIMLQQTRVATVLPYYESFLARFPSVRALAVAEEENVLAAWSGLGYYRRARQLHRAARVLVEDHSGRLPETIEELLAIPGIGRYTAGAIASLAFDQPAPVLDGNVKRVLSRLRGWKDRATWGPMERNLWELATWFAEGLRPGETNQGLMELGALICHHKRPECPSCPWRNDCVAHQLGMEDACPAPIKRPTPIHIDVVALWIERRGRILLQQREPSAPLRGNWDIPAIETRADNPETTALSWAESHDLSIRPQAPGSCLLHHILNRRLTLIPLRSQLLRGRVAGNQRLCWVPLAELKEFPVSGATWKLVRHHHPDTA